jgi:hypothetical protein
MIDLDELSIDEIIERISNTDPDIIIWADPFVGRAQSVIWTPNWMNLISGESQMLDPCDSISESFLSLYKHFDDNTLG